MRTGFLLLFMAVTGAGFIVMANALESAWPLIGIWAAYGLAIPLSSRGVEDEAADAGGEPQP